MFKGTLLLRAIDCPEERACCLPNCAFSHDFIVLAGVEAAESQTRRINAHDEQDLVEQPHKRRRLNNADSGHPSGSFKDFHVRSPHRTSFQSQAKSENERSSTSGAVIDPHGETAQMDGKKRAEKEHAPADGVVSLNPSMIANPPAAHAIRTQFVRLLYEQYNRLNDELKASDAIEDRELVLPSEETKRIATAEEHKLAVDHYRVYANVIKLRILRLRKTKLTDWVAERRKSLIDKAANALPSKQDCDLQTGLRANQDVAFLQRLIANQEPLEKHGYVVRKPTIDEIEEARKGLEAAHGWEQCDRCRTRFQVFADRRVEDGALTSGGSCTYHPGRSRRPLPTDRADKFTRDPVFNCCKETVGASAGCTVAPTHVFRSSHTARLELVESFAETPESNFSPLKTEAICFDCEMGYTTLGLELIRLTAINWLDGKEIIDVLVRPNGHVLDLNSRYSGVWPKDFVDAVAYNYDAASEGQSHNTKINGKAKSRMVDSPAAARTLLFSHMNARTPLIGHALENDLNAVRIIHPSIIDTVLLYPHPKGLPVRFGLKALMKRHLDRDIQTGDGGAGHDSKEDAKAAGDLVRLKVQQGWKKMQREGWTVQGEAFLPPMTRAEAMKAELAAARQSNSQET